MAEFVRHNVRHAQPEKRGEIINGEICQQA